MFSEKLTKAMLLNEVMVRVAVIAQDMMVTQEDNVVLQIKDFKYEIPAWRFLSFETWADILIKLKEHQAKIREHQESE